MRIIGVYGQNLVFNLSDQAASEYPRTVTDLDSMYTPNGFMLPLGYGDTLVDIYDGIRADALREQKVLVLGLQLTHTGILHSFGLTAIKTESMYDRGIEYRRIPHGPDTRRFWGTEGDMAADALSFILDQFPGKPEKAFDVYCKVVSMDRKSLVFLPFSEIQAKLIEKGFTKPLKLNDALSRATFSDIMGDFTESQSDKK